MSAPPDLLQDRPPILRRALKRVRKLPLALDLAVLWVLAMVLIAITAHWLSPYDIAAIDLTHRLAPPMSPGHLLGTDELGRDVLSRLFVSIRSSLTIASLATVLSAIIGTVAGFLAAERRGLIEQAVLTLVDFQATLPFMIFALAVLAFVGSSVEVLVGLMAFFGWERYARLARGLAMTAKAHGYANAVVQLGARAPRVYLHHILPNVSATLVVTMTITFTEVVLVESGLSFLGLGVQLPNSSLGNMVGFGRDYIGTAPWIMLAPAVVITVTSISISIIGDWLRDRFDPATA